MVRLLYDSLGITKVPKAIYIGSFSQLSYRRDKAVGAGSNKKLIIADFLSVFQKKFFAFRKDFFRCNPFFPLDLVFGKKVVFRKIQSLLISFSCNVLVEHTAGVDMGVSGKHLDFSRGILHTDGFCSLYSGDAGANNHIFHPLHLLYMDRFFRAGFYTGRISSFICAKVTFNHLGFGHGVWF